MFSPEDAVERLRASGSIWEVAPGIYGLRGPIVSLLRDIESALLDIARGETREEWIAPAAVSFETLERARYFESFPQWLTAASHLTGDDHCLHEIAMSAAPGDAARSSLARADVALPPAICYNTYAALANSVIESPVLITAQGLCWRHEGDRLAPLQRGWAFTMREIVCVGAERDVRDFLDRCVKRVSQLERQLGLACEVVPASDPFFAPTARGRAALQRIKALKHEMEFRFTDGQPLAIASFNDHETFFGEAFRISLGDGAPAWSGCVAFGLERWLLAILATHGLNPGDWPTSIAMSGNLEFIGSTEK